MSGPTTCSSESSDSTPTVRTWPLLFLSVSPSIAALKLGYQFAGSRTRLVAGKYTPRM
ncbi:hypothetical protein SMF913_10094 [Streptomyces malaysiensis]|uniref:Uncharacterized protein n=1 Tax=Streptomyces malaysiensis TaxID=92644 RepID=A0A2J7Z1M2_STRMQ|nr:hypothetical protein SMF913_10094 [Streptomyces malaysiensis]